MAVRRQVGKEHNNIIMGFRAVRGGCPCWWYSGLGGEMMVERCFWFLVLTHVGVLL